MSQQPILNKIILDAEERRKQEIADLESRSKQLYELVATVNFTVDEVVAESYGTSFSSNSEMMIEGESPVHRGDFTSRLVLKVSPDKQEIPIRTLNFDGFSCVRAGDYISAQIPRYEEKRVRGEFYFGPHTENRIFYVDRDFNPEESAIELALFSADGTVLRKDRSVDYKNFVKK